MTLKRMVLALALALGLAAPAIAAEDDAALFVVVTAPDAQTQAMAMILTIQAVSKGAEARILLCGPAGDLALKTTDAPKLKTKMGPRSAQDLMRQAMSSGARAQVCAIYLPNSGHGEDALLDGVGAATPPEISAYMLRDDVRYFTF